MLSSSAKLFCIRALLNSFMPLHNSVIISLVLTLIYFLFFPWNISYVLFLHCLVYLRTFSYDLVLLELASFLWYYRHFLSKRGWCCFSPYIHFQSSLLSTLSSELCKAANFFQNLTRCYSFLPHHFESPCWISSYFSSVPWECKKN